VVFGFWVGSAATRAKHPSLARFWWWCSPERRRLILSLIRQLDDLRAWSRESFWYGLHSTGKYIQAYFKADERDSSERWDSTLLQAFGQMSPNLNSLTIVVVEDNNDVRGRVGAFLDRSGAKVVMARDGHEGLEVVKNTFPDLVLSDIKMPGMGGFELLREIRALGTDAGCSVPVIAMTAFPMPNQRAHILGAGFQACLPKPFTPNNLLETILRVLDQ
jgi:CheY-like chemotaxis protein